MGFKGLAGVFLSKRLVFELESHQKSARFMNLFGNLGKKIKGYRSMIFRFQAEKISWGRGKGEGQGINFFEVGE